MRYGRRLLNRPAFPLAELRVPAFLLMEKSVAGGFLSARVVCKRGKAFPSLHAACANGGRRSPLCARRMQTGEGVRLSARVVRKRGKAFPSLHAACANG